MRAVQKRLLTMRHERFIPMEYANQALMDELNEWSIALKVWLYPELFEDKIHDLQRRYPKPELSEIDNFQNRINQVLRKDAKPFISY